jgi:hypothetical protein
MLARFLELIEKENEKKYIGSPSTVFSSLQCKDIYNSPENDTYAFRRTKQLKYFGKYSLIYY